ncbi:MAG: DUF2339 domain-containing protein [Desulfarculales bacterium]|jgi:uncharacterized membrane protein|nr:DUF2339 domain-containing protein [Desulfarculales bacterium]
MGFNIMTASSVNQGGRGVENRFDRLDEILREHARTISALEQELDSFKRNDLLTENNALRRQLAENEGKRRQTDAENQRLTTDNLRLRNELYSHIFNEKIRVLDSSEQRLNVLFQARIEGERSRLRNFEDDVRRQTDRMLQQLAAYDVSKDDSIYEALEALKAKVAEAVAEAGRRAEALKREFFSDTSEKLRQLRDEPLTEEQINRIGKRNNLETFLGLNLFNKLGLLFILIGAVAAARFSYPYIPDIAKGALIYLLGVIMLGGGEWLSRKQANVFSTGLTAGGVAVLYSATAVCFFTLQILSLHLALLLCLLTTAAALILSRRYDSQTVSAFALAGGYLPVFYLQPGFLLYSAMGYFLILNTLSLLMALKRHWLITQYIGFGLNFASAAYIIRLLLSSYYGTAEGIVILVYIFIAFTLYQALPLLSVYTAKVRLQLPDLALLIMDLVLGSIMLFTVLWAFGWWRFAGSLSIALCVTCALIALLLQKKIKEEKAVQAQFYLTALAFAILVIPFQLDIAYLSLGWLLESMLLLSYGIWKEEKKFIWAGGSIYGLCLVSFLGVDILLDDGLFFYKYLFITLSTLWIFASLIHKNVRMILPPHFHWAYAVFKCVVLVNLWLFINYAIYAKLYPLILEASRDFNFSFYFCSMMVLVITMAFAYALPRIPRLADGLLHAVSLCLYGLSFLFLFTANARSHFDVEPAPLLLGCGIAILIISNLLCVFAARDLLLRLMKIRILRVEYYPLAISSFFVILLLQNLIVTLHLSYNSLVITFLLALTALAWILFGFLKRYQYNRIFGLSLSFMAAIKLFILDLAFSDEGMRILAYFIMGVTLLAVSFVYQHFNRKLNRREGEKS